MFKFLFMMFFFFLLLVFLMGFSILRTVKNVLFGSGDSSRKEGQRCQTNSRSSSHTRSNGSSRNEYASQPSRKKIFAEDEGEYVDYEEVK